MNIRKIGGREINMLKIWYYGGTEYMGDAPAYFDNVYEDEWMEDEFVKEMIGRGSFYGGKCACD